MALTAIPSAQFVSSTRSAFIYELTYTCDCMQCAAIRPGALTMGVCKWSFANISLPTLRITSNVTICSYKLRLHLLASPYALIDTSEQFKLPVYKLSNASTRVSQKANWALSSLRNLQEPCKLPVHTSQVACC